MAVLTRELLDVVHYVKRAAPEQGGIISGANPSAWNTKDPFPLWVIQVFIIICFTQLLALLLSKVRQPRVIAEVIGGILLGPTVMGRIPHFSDRIFPTNSIPLLTLTSTIGLVLFLFLVGLEIDVRVLRRNAKSSLTISAVGMIIPFGLGVGLAVALYREFVSSDVNFGHFLLFVGVAVAITAFPVLCRILTDLNLLDDHVGIIVLSAGVGNDVVGWILLALAVALTNASSGLTALWILLAGAAFILFMLYPVRWAFVWLARRTGSLENGSPTPSMMTVTLLVIFASAFFTDVIGIHPIFGGFIAGLIVPHEGGFAIALVEKLEDLVCIVFLPLYFTLSGLNTNLGLLNDGITWGYIVLICTIAFFGKYLGCAITAKLMGFSNRESSAIGSLMSCKGLVELIVLNVGLSANILDTRVFSMFVVHALVLTVLTTPLTLWAYPPQYRHGRKLPADPEKEDNSRAPSSPKASEDIFKSRFSVFLNTFEHLPAIMAITQLLQPVNFKSIESSDTSVASEKDELTEFSGDITHEKQLPELDSLVKPSPLECNKTRVSVNALRLIELSDRTSAVMKSSEADDLIRRDALISVFSTFGRLNRIPVASSLSVVPQDAFSSSIAMHARETGSQLVIIPWHSGTSNVLHEEGGPSVNTPDAPSTVYNPFDSIFNGNKASAPDRTSSVVYGNFVRKVFAESPTDVALFIDRGGTAPGDQHIFLPFWGGPDDRLALRFAVQLCANANITASVVRVRKSSNIDHLLTNIHTNETGVTDIGKGDLTAERSITVIPDTIYPNATTQTRMASEVADDVLWTRFTKPSVSSTLPLTSQVQAALKRVTFSEVSTPNPLQTVIQRAVMEATIAARSGKSLLLVVGRGRRMMIESHRAELDRILVGQPHVSINSDLTKTIGEIAAGFVAGASTMDAMLVMQAGVEPVA